MDQKQKRIIDSRKKEKFMVDDEYLNGMAKLCGWKGSIVYFSLCRHANIDQESFPSIKLMAKENGVGRNTIIKGIEILEKRNVIEIQKKRTKSGQWLNNTYNLLDKSEWNYNHVPIKDLDIHVPLRTHPCPSRKPDHVPLVNTKETHSKGNTYKEKHIVSKDTSQNNEYGNKDLNEIIEYARSKNFGIQGSQQENRRYAWNLYQNKSINHDIDKIKQLIDISVSLWGIEYKPQILDFKSLFYKWASIYVHKVQEQNNITKIGVVGNG